ncbi:MULTISPECIES: hypothetical protein [unclassified Microbacterium]|uniref:hypothetical protein n=1 Tax=unclassified Microbacterium TaxID=2609290 RepID=UPI00214CC7B2|nr:MULTISPECIES: hypothetical protein [unclassified Microbacterium]MCR2783911.1 hypothetical protein [Microbacterium sp. zg.B96]MDL5351297.1 hypothetical protein [Microbacterium sp. zg-YB36]WIM15244.1 hypothetical protein QNO11_11925 [Microbacterium sp. zg-B96]
MSLLSIVRSAAGAALLLNAVPHGVKALQGEPFPSPFADPPGVGMSRPAVNVVWSAINATAGSLLLGRGVRTVGERIAAGLGALGMAFVLAAQFGDVMRGGTGLAGKRVRS